MASSPLGNVVLTVRAGLGVMGYGMAVNLRSKLNRSQTLYVCDVSDQAIQQFQSEVDGKGPVEVVKNGAEASKSAVRRIFPSSNGTHDSNGRRTY